MNVNVYIITFDDNKEIRRKGVDALQKIIGN